MAQVIALLILGIIIAALVFLLVSCYNDYRYLQKENDNYDKMFKEEFRLHSDSLSAYEAMMREACRSWPGDAEEDGE